MQTSVKGRVFIEKSAGQAPVARLLLNSNGQRLLAAAETGEGWNKRLAVQVWDTARGHLLGPAFALPWAEALATLSPDGTRLLAASPTGTVATLWDTSLGRTVYDLPHSNTLSGLTFSPNGARLVTWEGNHAFLWDPANGMCVRQIVHPSRVGHVEFSPDGRWFITCATFSQLRPSWAQLFDSETGNPVRKEFWHTDGVEHAAFSPDGKRLVTASEDRSARIWNIATGKQLTPPLIHRDQVLDACFSPDGRRIATLCRGQTIRIWDAASGAPMTPSLHSWTMVGDFQFIEGGSRLLCARAPRNLLTLDPRLYESWVYDLSPDQRPASELSLIAQVLSAHRGAELGPGLPLDLQELQEGWRKITAKHPSDFKVSDEEVRAWDQTEARISEESGDWQAALFHLRRLAQAQPGNEDVARRLSRAETESSPK